MQDSDRICYTVRVRVSFADILRTVKILQREGRYYVRRTEHK